MQPFTLEDLEHEWTDAESRALDKDEARRDAEAELDEDDDGAPREPTKAERTLALVEDRAQFLTEQRARIAKYDLAIEKLEGALKLAKDRRETAAVISELEAQLARARRHRDHDNYVLRREDRDTLARAKRNVARRETRGKGKWVRGTHYASKPRERSADWYYDKTPKVVRELVEARKLQAVDGMYAGIIARHLETHQRSKGDKARRITCEELAAKAGRERKSAQRAIRRMVDEGALIVVSSGKGKHHGALYTFPSRDE